MAEPPPYPGDHTAAEPARTPRWVIVFGIIVLVLVALFVVMHITGGHGPRRHTSAAGNLTALFDTGHADVPPAWSRR